ncbi:hypothetical protein DSLASN_15320 [Desulfoluna limicola]|uniref:DUF6933 domain-containing protein n=1 Tax=Desulfoluna limicola TaxID=2810562 RepID=A0ABM7PFD7_9BACT|nr:hypothetical protein [Desulfoluna limicola]BCS95900.1 hypothetical protein DSLASN_15320 [Desulfoluna limicola]
MLVFNCTKAFATFIDNSKEPVVVTPSIKKIAEDPSFIDGTSMQWLVHVVTVKRTRCVIAMHAGSRYAIVMTGVKKGDFAAFADAFCNRLINEMFFLCFEAGRVGEEHASLVAENFVDKHLDVQVYQRGDRSVQAHISDVAWYLEEEVKAMGDLPEGDDEAFEFGRHVNAVLRKTKGDTDYFYPFEVMQQVWFEDVCAEIVDPESLDGLSDDRELPDNVVCLADYRKTR